MFVDVALARRLELAEARLTLAIAGAARPPAVVHTLDGAVATLVAPGSPINKVVGLGFAAVDEAILAAIEAAWRERGEAVRVEIATLADPDVLAALGARGYRLQGFENVLGRALADLPDEALSAGVTVERVTDATAAAWGEAAVEGFAHPDGTGAGAEEHSRDAIEQVLADFARTPGIRRYLARCDGVVAGAASVRLEERVAQLCGATTVPAARRRGVQRALLATRLAEARAEGCDLAVVTTAPGSQSQANVQRRGFALLYARAVLIKAWA